MRREKQSQKSVFILATALVAVLFFLLISNNGFVGKAVAVGSNTCNKLQVGQLQSEPILSVPGKGPLYTQRLCSSIAPSQQVWQPCSANSVGVIATLTPQSLPSSSASEALCFDYPEDTDLGTWVECDTDNAPLLKSSSSKNRHGVGIFEADHRYLCARSKYGAWSGYLMAMDHWFFCNYEDSKYLGNYRCTGNKGWIQEKPVLSTALVVRLQPGAPTGSPFQQFTFSYNNNPHELKMVSVVKVLNGLEFRYELDGVLLTKIISKSASSSWSTPLSDGSVIDLKTNPIYVNDDVSQGQLQWLELVLKSSIEDSHPQSPASSPPPKETSSTVRLPPLKNPLKR